MGYSWVYLVTGGCGFIGEKIVEVLSQQDYIKEVRVFGSVAREEVEKFTTGTENVLRACCILNIPYVVYTSSIAAVGPNTLHEPIWQIQCTHSTVNRKIYLLLNTCFSPPLISPGNVAWMHVLAARNLQLKPDLLAEQVCYSYDDTPTRKGFLIRHQLLSSVNPSVRLGSHIPYWKMWLMIQLHRIIRVILYPFWKPQPFLNLSLLNTVVTTFSYETDKASRYFGYKPLFTWKESKHRTAQWLEAAAGNLEQPQLHEKNS
uniref:3-beta hydroxysteroid dehydrogenase/isomerase domain-containing protein n=1 Tax=Strix occidentalis caurina TaxID=311401 RepID=A0A8D0FEG8_STROC